jgi:hypothetical protein
VTTFPLVSIQLSVPLPSRQRKGLVAVAALVCLLVVTSIVISMLQGSLRTRNQLLGERDRCQTEMLLEAGADRAVARLAAEPSFQGDTWELPAAMIVGNGAGRVTTNFSRVPNSQTLQLRVVAEYPLGHNLSIKRSHTFQIETPASQ